MENYQQHSCDGDHWGVEQLEDGTWVVTWRGEVFSSPRHTKQAALESMERARKRYPNCTADILMAVVPGSKRKQRRRGGPYEYELPANGKDYGIEPKGLIPAKSMKEAREVLAKWMRRKRLPKGTALRRAA